MVEGYCCKCKKKVNMQNIIETETSKKVRMRKGKCACGATVCRIGN